MGACVCVRQDATVRSSGTLLCLASAAAFGAMAVFAKLAYGEGVTLGTMLAGRFLVAAGVFWLLVLVRGGAPRVRALPRRDVVFALALGGVGYATQAGTFFAALERLDASLLSLLLYTFPAMVTVAAIVLGRERVSPRRIAALVLTSAGLVLVLAGAGAGELDPLGAALGLTAAVVYSAYILVSEPVAGRVPAQLLAALVCTGAAVTLTTASAAAGALHPSAVTVAGWGWIACVAVVSTVGAITLFFAGLRRAGPTTASILSTVEPVVTVSLAFAVFGERLAPGQLLGGGLVLAAVVLVSMRASVRARRWVRRPRLAAEQPVA
jgi:drug/metabolite transporter (DMT)-like permease